MYPKDPCEGEAYVCAANPTIDRKPVILERTRRSFWGGHPGHFAADEAVILNRTARSYWSGLRMGDWRAWGRYQTMALRRKNLQLDTILGIQ